MYPVYVRGEAYLKGGKGEQAAAEFQKLLFTPLILQWTLGNGWFADLGVTFIAPDGSRYNGTNNPDYWTVEPRGGVAYIDQNWHFTANFKYDINCATWTRSKRSMALTSTTTASSTSKSIRSPQSSRWFL